jgi:hypothetical protein
LVVTVEIHVLQYLVNVGTQALTKLAQPLIRFPGEQLEQKLKNYDSE